MNRPLLACLLGLGAGLAAGEPPGLAPAPWKLEAVEFKDGRRLEGLITAPAAGAADDEDVFFVQVVRPPGRPMYLVSWGPLAGERIAMLERLPAAEHERLAGRIRGFREDRERRLDAEHAIELERGATDASWRYATDAFVLESTADPGVTREAALRLTQVFGALENLVPPVVAAGRPTTVRLCGTSAEYRAEQEALGIRVANPAFFVPARRLLVAGSDLPALVAERRAAADANAAAARRLDDLDRRLPERLKELAADLERQGVPATRSRRAGTKPGTPTPRPACGPRTARACRPGSTRGSRRSWSRHRSRPANCGSTRPTRPAWRRCRRCSATARRRCWRTCSARTPASSSWATTPRPTPRAAPTCSPGGWPSISRCSSRC